MTSLRAGYRLLNALLIVNESGSFRILFIGYLFYYFAVIRMIMWHYTGSNADQAFTNILIRSNTQSLRPKALRAKGFDKGAFSQGQFSLSCGIWRASSKHLDMKFNNALWQKVLCTAKSAIEYFGKFLTSKIVDYRRNISSKRIIEYLVPVMRNSIHKFNYWKKTDLPWRPTYFILSTEFRWYKIGKNPIPLWFVFSSIVVSSLFLFRIPSYQLRRVCNNVSDWNCCNSLILSLIQLI